MVQLEFLSHSIVPISVYEVFFWNSDEGSCSLDEKQLSAYCLTAVKKEKDKFYKYFKKISGIFHSFKRKKAEKKDAVYQFAKWREFQSGRFWEFC